MNDTLEEITFEGKRGDEKLIVFTRRHWYYMAGSFIGTLFASILPIILIILLAPFIVSYQGGSIVFMFFWMVYLMILWYILAYKLTLHSLDTWIVTDDRILDIVQLGFFSRKVSELHLEAIQDVSVNTHGIVESYLNFGNIEIQTAATAQRFMFDNVPNPIKIKDMIMDAADQLVQDTKKEM